jgi:hypothetical protein
MPALPPLFTLTGPLPRVVELRCLRQKRHRVVGRVQAQFPGLLFTLAGPVDAHHNQARFMWVLASPGPSRWCHRLDRVGPHPGRASRRWTDG